MRSWLWQGAVVTATGLLVLLPVAAPAASAAGNDPRGANGTIKIDGQDFDDGPEVANEPHVTCELQLAFFGFDKGQQADVVFSEHAPTGSALVREDHQLAVSDDQAGGAAPDPDQTYRYEVLAGGPGDGDADGLRDIVLPADAKANPQQGYHLRVDVQLYDADGAAVPGAGKHKVFWVEPCTSRDAVAGQGTVAAAAGTGQGAAAGQRVGVEAGGAGAGGGTGTADGATDTSGSAPTRGDTAVLGTKFGLPPSTAARARLAFTGAGAAVTIGALGALLLVGGAVLTVVARRRTSRGR